MREYLGKVSAVIGEHLDDPPSVILIVIADHAEVECVDSSVLARKSGTYPGFIVTGNHELGGNLLHLNDWCQYRSNTPQ